MKSRPAILPDAAGIFGLVVFLVLVRFAGPKALHDGDTLWHIKVGQIILDNGQLVTSDTFSHTAFGHPWVAHEWLAEIFMAALYNFGGLSAVAISFFLIAALSFNLLFLSARRFSGEWPSLIAVSLAAVPMAFTHLYARPHLFTWLCGAITLYCLVCNDKRLWLLPFLTALWGNLHGGVLLGLLLQGCFVAGKLLNDRTCKDLTTLSAWPGQNRRLIFVLVLSTLATGLNPFGFYPFAFNLQVSADIFSTSIGEWKSADFQSLWYVRIWFIWMVLVAAWSSRKTDWVWALLIPVLLYQAMAHVRHISIAAMMMVPWLAQNLSSFSVHLPTTLVARKTDDTQQLELSCWTGPLLTVSAFIVLFILSVQAPPFWQNFSNERFPLPENYSAEAIEFISHKAPGKKLLNEYSWGDYLIYALDPPPPVFIDGRADMYGAEIFDDYMAAANLRKDVDETFEKYQIDWVLFNREHPLVRYLEAKPDWRMIYSDEKTAILAIAEKVDRG